MKNFVFAFTLLVCFLGHADDRQRAMESARYAARFEALQNDAQVRVTTEHVFQENVGNVTIITRSSQNERGETTCKQYTQDRTGARSYVCTELQNPCYQNPLCQ